MINCSSLTFRLEYKHVDAHQDDGKDFALLKRPAQMNCMYDGMAKGVVWGLAGEKLPKQGMFPLESVAVYVGEDKLSSDMSKHVRFWVHKQIAKEVFAKLSTLDEGQFDEVAWEMVWGALKETPRMFQIWASKQVMDVAGVNKNLAKYKPRQIKRCPSCNRAVETCAHVLACREEGRGKNLSNSLRLVDVWLQKVGTHDALRSCLMQYARERGRVRMENIVWGKSRQFWELGRSMDKIGWQRFMEGMISGKAVAIQKEFAAAGGCNLSLDNWAKGLVVKLLEATHGLWLYRNVVVHDLVGGLEAVVRKQELQVEIERQIELGGDGLDEQDKYLLEINLEDLEQSSGEDHYYWLLAIQAAREDRVLKVREEQSRRENCCVRERHVSNTS